ncbi:MAG TPA: cytochrome b [Candidatus Acidoferrum sp.]|nr:cytochrome b [Candidatus Acidoferrum sp.]
MSWKNSADRYGPVSIALHWSTLAFMVLAYVLIELHDEFKRSQYGRALEDWHGVMGLTILLLVFARLALRLVQVEPRITPKPAQWEMIGARLMHSALYLFMTVMPLLGWGILSAEGHDILFWGLHIPPLTAKDRAFAKQLSEVHETIGNIGYLLIGLHAAAALFHHYYKRDDTLKRMLPRKGGN